MKECYLDNLDWVDTLLRFSFYYPSLFKLKPNAFILHRSPVFDLMLFSGSLEVQTCCLSLQSVHGQRKGLFSLH